VHAPAECSLPCAGTVQGTGQCTHGTEVAATFLEATGANLHWRQLPRSDPPSRVPRMTVFPKE
jgi:hypothetical protein